MTARIFGFAFTRFNISSRTLYSLSGIDYRYLLWGESTMNRYLKLIIDKQPKYLVGMGIYTGRDKEHIRIETVCTNQFRKSYISGDTIQKQVIKPFVQESGVCIFSQSIGASYCNLISWKIMSAISEGKLKCQYTFLHIPKSMNVELVRSEVQKLLNHIL